LNELETQVIDALTAVGADAVGIAEKGFRDAQVSGVLSERRAFVHAAPSDFPRPPETVVGPLEVGGHPAEEINRSGIGAAVRFNCGDTVYVVASIDLDWSSDSGRLDEAIGLANTLRPQLCG